jgi:cytochrome c peroxidase
MVAAWLYMRPVSPEPWTSTEIETLRSLWIGSLPPVPADPTNAVADSVQAAEFGHRLFFDTRLSGTGGISCSTCHQPERRFTDGLAKGQAIGTSKRNTRSIVGVAYSPWLYWDGRRDSLWSQALSPLEDPAEHGGNRGQYVEFIASDPASRMMTPSTEYLRISAKPSPPTSVFCFRGRHDSTLTSRP